jgi:hypothetical protein
MPRRPLHSKYVDKNFEVRDDNSYVLNQLLNKTKKVQKEMSVKWPSPESFKPIGLPKGDQQQPLAPKPEEEGMEEAESESPAMTTTVPDEVIQDKKRELHQVSELTYTIEHQEKLLDQASHKLSVLEELANQLAERLEQALDENEQFKKKLEAAHLLSDTVFKRVKRTVGPGTVSTTQSSEPYESPFAFKPKALYKSSQELDYEQAVKAKQQKQQEEPKAPTKPSWDSIIRKKLAL